MLGPLTGPVVGPRKDVAGPTRTRQAAGIAGELAGTDIPDGVWKPRIEKSRIIQLLLVFLIMMMMGCHRPAREVMSREVSTIHFQPARYRRRGTVTYTTSLRRVMDGKREGDGSDYRPL